MEDENYYNVINGYKDSFLKCDENGNFVTPEEFRENVTFDEVYSLYKLDRKLRNVLLEYLLVFETNIKSRIAYYFSKKYPNSQSYLEVSNYSSDLSKENSISQMIATLRNNLNNKDKKPLVHYIKTHDGVPLWVLVNYLTIGNINYMYKNLEEDLRVEIALDYKNKANLEYGNNLQIQPTDIEGILLQVNLFRNVCAHEERLYDFVINKPIHLANNFSNFNKLTSGLKDVTAPENKSSLFDMIIMLKPFLNKTDYENLLTNIDNTIKYYEKEFTTLRKEDVYIKMGCQYYPFSKLI